eukprot:TRINITY_DN9224_c3_g1_i2.p1 TRINITY_DN9224_c3_g1~~TRINITY_DN9224_c3_g1_i2.p1  ORF type:complete len:561 (+),score=79.78 TRINITY_DN9224_c3_g1_i2:130-1812(+)
MLTVRAAVGLVAIFAIVVLVENASWVMRSTVNKGKRDNSDEIDRLLQLLRHKARGELSSSATKRSVAGTGTPTPAKKSIKPPLPPPISPKPKKLPPPRPIRNNTYSAINENTKIGYTRSIDLSRDIERIAQGWDINIKISDNPKQATCSSPPGMNEYQEGKKMLHAHKKKKKHEFTPIDLANNIRSLHEEGVLEFHEVEGSSIPSTVNDVPILDTHNGKFSIFKSWGDRKLWKNLHWIEDPEQRHHEKKLPNAIPEQPPLWVAIAYNGWTNQGNVFTCDYALTTGACLWEMSNYKKPKKKFTKILALCDSWCRGYFHFAHEHLPRVAVVHQALLDDPDIMITVPTNRDFIVSYFHDVLGIDKKRLIGTTTAAADVLYYPQPQPCGSMWTHGLMLLRKIVFNRHSILGSNDPNTFLVVLAERAGGQDGKSRNPTNYQSVKQRLAEAQYPTARKVVFESSLNKTILEQIKVFYKADMVIGPHGANLANIMWMRSGTSVIEFMSYKYGNLCYYVCAQRVGLDFRFVMQPSDKGGAYSVDFDEIKRHIDDSILRSEGMPALEFT